MVIMVDGSDGDWWLLVIVSGWWSEWLEAMVIIVVGSDRGWWLLVIDSS